MYIDSYMCIISMYVFKRECLMVGIATYSMRIR